MDQEKKNSGKATEKAAADNESVKSAKKPAAKKKSTGSSTAKKGSSKKSSSAKKGSDNRTHASTANGSANSKKGTASTKKQSAASDTPRSEKTAHRILPVVLFIFAIFIGISLFLNLFCNPENTLANDPSEHWMGSVGYYICYIFFGMFGPAVFVLPFLLGNLAIFWKKYVDNRLAVAKIIASLAFVILFGAFIHICTISGWVEATRHLTSAQLIELGSQMKMGGLIGGGVGYFFITFLNTAGSIILLICILVALLFFILGMTPQHIWNFLQARRNQKKGDSEDEFDEDENVSETGKKKKNKAESEEESDIPQIVGSPKASMETAKNGKSKSDRLAPMPMPKMDPHEGKLFVPADVNRKLAEEKTVTNQSEKIPARPASPMTGTAPAQAQAPFNPAANKDAAIDPIFPKNDRLGRPASRVDHGFDLKEVFADPNAAQNPAQKQHAPVPPEVPMPSSGTRPVRPVTETAQSTAPATPVATPAAAATKPAASKSASQPTLREVKDIGQKEFGLSNEEFEQLESQSATLPKSDNKASADAKREPVTTPVEVQQPKPYSFPPLSYLHAPEPMTEENQEEIRATVNNLYQTLQNFRINIVDIAYSFGPTVTRYELAPAPGVRVRSIVNLADDISLAFASKVRIEAPIPGKSAVGIEVPNKKRSNVFLRELIESKAFQDAPSKLTSCLGADVTGQPLLFDIAKMPHLLIAGATGMGKSVCINSVIMSLLYKARPDEVKLILIDPKKVEFGIYKGIPHLLAPIVTSPKDAAGALQAAVEEMENRFELIQQVGARDIKGYNKVTENDPDMPFMPQIVIIIDELADLMMTAPDEVETAICRLAQKARAAGMHIIIGTQRPSVDVVTGLIKSNIPSRIAFTVASQVDSRTILDVAGAEKLIGKGDMLFAPVGAMGFTRVQGAFVDEKEVENICDFIRATNGTASYDERFTSKMKELSAQCGSKGKGGGDSSPLPEGGAKGDDSKYSDAVRIAVEEKKISTSLLQRKLEIGYSRAAKLIDRMQAEGIVSAPDGSKPRTSLITPEEYIARFIDVPDVPTDE